MSSIFSVRKHHIRVRNTFKRSIDECLTKIVHTRIPDGNRLTSVFVIPSELLEDCRNSKSTATNISILKCAEAMDKLGIKPTNRVMSHIEEEVVAETMEVIIKVHLEIRKCSQ